MREDSEDHHPSHSCAQSDRVRTNLVVRGSPGAPTQEGPSMTLDTVPCVSSARALIRSAPHFCYPVLEGLPAFALK